MSSLKALREANIRRQAEWCPDIQPDISFRAVELGGETGEALNVVKKLVREANGWRGSRDTVEHLGQELADIIICTDLLAERAGIDLAKEVTRKFNDTSRANGLSVFMDETQ